MGEKANAIRRLGNSSLNVFRLGLGCMGMSEFYGPCDETDSIKVLHHALELGINFFDTADMYGSGNNEELLSRALYKHWDKVVLATKFGILRDKAGGFSGVCGRPDYVKQSCDASLKRLRRDTIDLYYLHRIDPDVPIEETIGAMAELVEAGKVRYIGISEANAGTLRRAHQTHPITALQNEFSVCSREPEDEILSLCHELNIGLVAYSPLGRGFLTGTIVSRGDLDKNDRRLTFPRFEERAMEQNRKFIEIMQEVATGRSVTIAQIALAWLLHQGDNVFPIPGTRKIMRLEENVAALDIRLSGDELALINKHLPAGSTMGSRYP